MEQEWWSLRERFSWCPWGPAVELWENGLHTAPRGVGGGGGAPIQSGACALPCRRRPHSLGQEPRAVLGSSDVERRYRSFLCLSWGGKLLSFILLRADSKALLPLPIPSPVVAQASSRVQVQHTFILQAHLAVVTSQVPPRHFCRPILFPDLWWGGRSMYYREHSRKPGPGRGLRSTVSGLGLDTRDPVLKTETRFRSS